MSTRVCLRCDWSGATAAEACPRCGAGLHGARSRRRPAPETAPTGPVETRVERSRWSALATVLVLVLVVAAIAIVQRSIPATQPAPSGSARGYLVYAGDDAGSPRLWVWNLSDATVTPGPRLDAIPTDLSFTYTTSSGWVSATVPSSGGLSYALLLRTLDTVALPEPLGHGELVTWLPSGGYVSVAKTKDLEGCRRRLIVESSNVSLDVHRRSLNLAVCGHPTMLGRDLTRPYVTIEHGNGASVYGVNDRRLVSVLRGYRALTVSLNGDLLVQRPRDRRTISYYYPSPAGRTPERIERGDEPLRPEHVLGWSGDASAVFVLGAIGDVRGIFRISVSPRVEPRAPTLVLRTDARDVSVSTTPTGDVYASADGEVTFVDDGAPHPLTRPIGAPPVMGPLLWISTLPYSPSVAG